VTLSGDELYLELDLSAKPDGKSIALLRISELKMLLTNILSVSISKRF
jgi:hypothetical protein